MLFSMAILSSCKKEIADSNSDGLKTGTVSGRVFAANGKTFIPGAKVFIDFNGELYYTTTNNNGTFLLPAPAGKQVLNIQTGNGRIFRTLIDITIEEDKNTSLSIGAAKLNQAAPLAYIKGLYDNIETVVIDSLGYTATEIQVSDLNNLSLLQTYGGIFLNCGKYGALDSLKYYNLAQFVVAGGSIYASDFAVDYLTGDGNYKGIPLHVKHKPAKNCTPDIGGFINDTTLCTDKSGPDTTINARIIATDLSAFIGASSANIIYDKDGWEAVKLYTKPWQVMVEDTANLGPLVLRMQLNSYTKTIQKQFTDGWVTICHIPPGQLSNAHTITISVNALPTHLAHGDYIGSCTGTGGLIYFTTFHTHIQGVYNSGMKKMLDFFIFNL